MYDYRARVSRVVDGDTVDLSWLDLGWGSWLVPTQAQPLRLRLAYINAYEVTRRGGTTEHEKAKGLEAKAWLDGQVCGKRVRVRSVKGFERGNFGRLMVWLWHDGPDDEVLRVAASLNMEILRRGWAVPYDRKEVAL